MGGRGGPILGLGLISSGGLSYPQPPPQNSTGFLSFPLCRTSQPSAVWR